MASRNMSSSGSPLPSRGTSSKFALEVFTFGRLTKYEPSEIQSRLSDASASLAVAIEELRKFSPYLSDAEFTAQLEKCSLLTQLVVEQMEKRAAKKISVVGKKKFQAMIEAAREYEEACSEAAGAVTRISKAAKERSNDEKRRTGSSFRPPRDDLEKRVRRLQELEATLRTKNPTLGLSKEATLELEDMLDELDFLDMENGTTEDDLSGIDQKVKPLVERLQPILRNLGEYRRLVACPKSNAQRLLDMFQQLLDSLDESVPGFHSHLVVATQRLAVKSGLYPTSYELLDVTVGTESPCSGGFADVYKGVYQHRPVCLKVIRTGNVYAPVDKWLKACSKESILWGQLSHPNVLPFYGIFRVQGKPALVGPWMDHGNVVEHLRKNPNTNRALLVLDVAEGLRFLHKRKVIHGDLKGPNVLVMDSGRACLADFGISSVSCPDIPYWTSASSVGSMGGTFLWQSPELMEEENGRKPENTKASDVYAWACVAYEIFTGRMPFDHLEGISFRDKIKRGERPQRPSDSSPSWNVWGLTKDIWSLMQECWVADPTERPTTDKLVNRLTAMLSIKNMQPVEKESAASAARFRQAARAGSTKHVELTVDVFDSLVVPPAHDASV